MGGQTYLGQMLIEAGLLDAYQVRSALGRQKKFGGRFASNVRALGFLPERTLVIFLAKQNGVPGLAISQSVIRLTNLDLVPREVAENHNVVPVRTEGNRVLLAMANPTDMAVADEIQFLTGLRVVEHVALHSSISDALRESYALRSDASKEYYFGDEVSMERPKDPLGYAEIVTGDSEFEDVAASDISAPPEEEEAPFQMQGAGPILDLEELENPAPPQDDQILFEDPVVATQAEESSSVGAAPAMTADGIPASAADRGIVDLDAEAAAGPQRKILVVDDEEEILTMVQRLLEKKGYLVAVARRGTEALEQIRTESPDLILLDAMLPEVHGFEICQKVKASKRFAHVPVIIVSAIYKGWRFKQDVRSLYGADGYVEKPFKIPDLLKEIEQVLAAADAEPIAEDGEGSEEVAEAAKRAYDAGLAAYQNKDHQAAIQFFSDAVLLSPLSSQLHFYLGNLYTQINQLYQAITEYEKTIELAPQFFPALKNLALLYQKMGFRNKSLEMWERSLRACEDDAMKTKIKSQIVELL